MTEQPIIVRDFSHWNKIDDLELVEQSSAGTIIKTYDHFFDPKICPGREDPLHDRFIGTLRKKPFGEYLFHRPTIDPLIQAEGYQRVAYHGMLDVIDAEDDGGLDNARLTGTILDMAGAMIQVCFRKPWLYANLNFLLNRITRPERLGPLLNGIMLAYPSTVRPTKAISAIEQLYGLPVHLWQWSWTAQCPGMMGNTDESLWLGTPADWNALVAGSRANETFFEKLRLKKLT